MSDPFQSRQPPDDLKQQFRDATEALRSTATEARAAAGQAAETVSQEAAAAAQTLKQQGAEVVQAAQSRAEAMAQQGQRSGAEQAEGIARAVHRAAEELQGTSPQLAGLVQDAAGSLDRMARGLRESSPGDMLHAVSDFARRQPLAFFGATVLAGFALTRFARASAPVRPERRNEYGRYEIDDMPGSAGQGGGYAGGHGGGMSPSTSGIPSEGAAQAPGWVQDAGGTARPATLASATLGGAAAMRQPGQGAYPGDAHRGDRG
jgi:hypothetical protein